MGPSQDPRKGAQVKRELGVSEGVVQSGGLESLSNLTFCISTDSSIREAEVPLVSAVPDSPDDLLASHFPIIDRDLLNLLRSEIDLFIARIRPQLERSSGVGPIEESIERRDLSFRFGAERFCFERGPIVWIECRCLDTGAYLLPDLDRVFRDHTTGSESEFLEAPPESFFEGYARLVLTFDRHLGGPVAVTPWISDACDLEADTHFLRALRGGGHLGASFLHSQYRRLLFVEGVRSHALDDNAASEVRDDFVEALGVPTITSVVTEENGDISYSIEYRDSRVEGIDALAPLSRSHVVKVTRVSPWGLSMSGIRFL